MSEPDIDWILEQWLERHPEVQGPERDIRIVRGTWTLPRGIKTEVLSVSIVAGEDIEGYDPAVEEYDSFGESAFNLTLKQRNRRERSLPRHA
jgi:hypothetical protein